ncbi:hypothetical protein N2152v2_009808 [Parachlorella kessleri]
MAYTREVFWPFTLENTAPSSSKAMATSMLRTYRFGQGLCAAFGRHGRRNAALSARQRGRCLSAAAALDTATAEAASSSSATTSEQPQQAATERRKRVLSGVQPTGGLHLGNYMGAIRNWVKLQELYDTFFFVVDLHAITLPHNPADLLQATRSSAALYIACGIDPERSSIFVQSHVPAHSELTWLLSCGTPIGWLRKMIQFKEKSKKAGAEEVGTGLLTYPVLMAADILLYQADLVPVGEDQRQHLELARDVAERFNYLYGGKKAKKMGCKYTRLFKVPEAFIPPAGARVMSLTDGTAKMSKSAESDFSRINLLDPPELIQKKIQRAKTDAVDGLELDNPDRPEARNLLTIYQCVTGMSQALHGFGNSLPLAFPAHNPFSSPSPSLTQQESVLEEVGGMRWGDFKPRLADAVVEHLRPIQERYQLVMGDPAHLDAILAKGAEAANKEANATLNNVRQAMGFVAKPL